MQRDDNSPRVVGTPWIRFAGERIEVTVRIPAGTDGRAWCWTWREAVRSIVADLKADWPVWGGTDDWDSGWDPSITWDRGAGCVVLKVWGERRWNGWDWKRATEAWWDAMQAESSLWGWTWWSDEPAQLSWWDELEQQLSEGWWWMTPGAAETAASSQD